ncbi:MAG: hypothetical protein WC284_14085, partial [Candidimonas sp.]
LTAMLLHQSNGTLTDFRGKLVVLAHGSIFSKVGASSKPGVIQYGSRCLALEASQAVRLSPFPARVGERRTLKRRRPDRLLGWELADPE